MYNQEMAQALFFCQKSCENKAYLSVIGSRAFGGGSPKKMPVTEPEFCPHSRKVVLGE